MKKQKENSREGITWSEMGKQNVHQLKRSIKASASKLKIIIDDLFVCSQGPAIKINSNQRYATTAVSSRIILIAEKNNSPVQVDFSQYFVI